jgi:hypothetical protein
MIPESSWKLACSAPKVRVFVLEHGGNVLAAQSCTHRRLVVHQLMMITDAWLVLISNMKSMSFGDDVNEP